MEVGHTGRPDDLMLPFRDRTDAGRILAATLSAYRSRPGTIVLGLPQCGVVAAAEVAHALDAPLDVVVSRKLGAPGRPEYAIGAVAEDGAPYLDEEAVRRTGASDDYVARELARQRGEITRCRRCYRGGRRLSLPDHATVILVDDGVATGSTAIAAIRALRRRGVVRLVFAVPVAPRDAAAVLRGMVDELVVLARPRHFHSVGFLYDDFAPVADEDVMEILRSRAEARPLAKEESLAVA